MKCMLSPVITLLVLSCWVSSESQVLPDFSFAIDINELPTNQWNKSLNIDHHQSQTVNLSFVHNIFPQSSQIKIETFYRRSDGYRLIKLSEGIIPNSHLYAQIDKDGQTYLRVSDGFCQVVAGYSKEEDHQAEAQFTLSKTDCVY